MLALGLAQEPLLSYWSHLEGKVWAASKKDSVQSKSKGFGIFEEKGSLLAFGDSMWVTTCSLI